MATKLRLEKALAVLVILTTFAIIGRDRILQQSYVITPDAGYSVRLFSDSRTVGNSETTMLDSGSDAYRWHCTLNTGYQYPYCGFEVRFSEDYTQGIDMSHFREVRLWLDYAGTNQTVRVFIRNFDPKYSRADDDTTTKYNQIEFKADAPAGYYEFSFNDFFVANWWLREKNIPPQLSHPQFDNIVSFEIQTGSGHLAGEHEFSLKRVELVGQRFSNEDWYFGIILCWAVVVLGFLAYRVVLLTGEVRNRKARENELIQVNALLDSRSRQLEEMAKTDSLTGAFNRKGIEEAIRSGLWEWRHRDKPLSIVMLDVDHFKAINDKHGHAVGDAVLAGISALVKEHIRGTDMFARWGGEEFVLVCRNTRINYAAHIAEKLRLLIAEYNFADDLKVTASFGVATLYDSLGIDQLFELADQALYKAKERGRNRIEVADAPVTSRRS